MLQTKKLTVQLKKLKKQVSLQKKDKKKEITRHVLCCAQSIHSCLTLMTPWTVAHRAPLSMGFSRQKYWSGWPFLFPGDLPNSRIKPESPASQRQIFYPLRHQGSLLRKNSFSINTSHSKLCELHGC